MAVKNEYMSDLSRVEPVWIMYGAKYVSLRRVGCSKMKSRLVFGYLVEQPCSGQLSLFRLCPHQA
jgi:hypothetical protein